MQITIQFDSTYPSEVRDAYDMILPLALKNSEGMTIKILVPETKPLTEEDLEIK